MSRVKPIPADLMTSDDLSKLRATTAGQLMQILKKLFKSKYFKELPDTATIRAGGISSFEWNKDAATKEIKRILRETSTK
jgi:hypothetical protein